MKVGTHVKIKATKETGYILYINPDGRLYEVRPTPYKFDWPKYYKAEELEEIDDARTNCELIDNIDDITDEIQELIDDVEDALE